MHAHIHTSVTPTHQPTHAHTLEFEREGAGQSRSFPPQLQPTPAAAASHDRVELVPFNNRLCVSSPLRPPMTHVAAQFCFFISLSRFAPCPPSALVPCPARLQVAQRQHSHAGSLVKESSTAGWHSPPSLLHVSSREKRSASLQQRGFPGRNENLKPLNHRPHFRARCC